MAKRITTQTQIKRLRAEGFSRRDIARVTGSSVSAVGRAERGQTKGESFAAPLGEFFKLGKRAKAAAMSGQFPLPSAKLARPAKGRGRGAVEKPFISPMERAEGKLSQYRAAEKVVVHLTYKQTGKSRTLFAHGGIEAGEISGNFANAIAAQGESQYGDDADVDYADYDMWDIDVEEY